MVGLVEDALDPMDGLPPSPQPMVAAARAAEKMQTAVLIAAVLHAEILAFIDFITCPQYVTVLRMDRTKRRRPRKLVRPV
jgi:hypothetical protein